MSRLIIPGRQLEIAYPTHNLLSLPLEFADRSLLVTAVRDFALTPMSARHIVRQPLIRRGRLGIEAIDADTGTKKTFWAEAARDGELPPYRLGLYDPRVPGELVDWIGRVFGPTERDRLAMRRIAQRWYSLIRARGPIGLSLAAWPVEA